MFFQQAFFQGGFLFLGAWFKFTLNLGFTLGRFHSSMSFKESQKSASNFLI